MAVQIQASSLLSVFIKGLTFLILCQSDLTNIIHHFPLSHLSLLCVVQDGKEQTQNIRSGQSNTQRWLESIQHLIVSKRIIEKCIAFICLLLTFRGQGSCYREWILNLFCAGDFFIWHMGGWEVNKKISSMEYTGENSVATPWMEHGQHTQLPQTILFWGSLNRGWSVVETAARFCQNPCTGGNSVVLSSW